MTSVDARTRLSIDENPDLPRVSARNDSSGVRFRKHRLVRDGASRCPGQLHKRTRYPRLGNLPERRPTVLALLS